MIDNIKSMYAVNNISISLLNAENKEEFLKKLRKICDDNNYDNIMIHFDVMDKDFVKGEGIDISLISLVKKYNFLVDVHLMCNDVIKYIDKAIELGADNIAIHYEIDDFNEKFIYLRKKAMENNFLASVAIKPDTKVKHIDKTLFYLMDVCLVMSVEPGYGMQSYIPFTGEKIYDVVNKYSKIVEVDGGINDNTILNAKVSGAKSFVIGSYFTKDVDNLEENIKKIMNKIGSNNLWS